MNIKMQNIQKLRNKKYLIFYLRIIYIIFNKHILNYCI